MTTTTSQTKFRAHCCCGWHGRAYLNGNDAWASLDNHNQKCRMSNGPQTVRQEVK